MKYIGIDAGKSHWVCILDENHKEVVPKFRLENSRSEYEKLNAQISLGDKICIESTGSFSEGTKRVSMEPKEPKGSGLEF